MEEPEDSLRTRYATYSGCRFCPRNVNSAMISENSVRNLVSRALASAFRRTDRRLKRRNSRTEQLETRALLAVFTVTSTADSGTGTLRQAILDANGAPGADQIVFAPATNGTEFDLTTGQMSITDAVTITGNGSSRTIIDGQQLSRIFDVTAGDVTLQRLTLKNGKTTANNEFGGAIRSTSTGTLTISESTFQGNSTTGTGSEGGAIRLQNGSIRIIDSTFQGNSTTGANANGGAIFSRVGTVQLIRSTLSGNSTAGINSAGGAIFAYSGTAHTTLIQSTLSGNSTAGTNASGGAVFSVFGNVTVGQSTVTSNRATLSGGGGIFSYSSPLNIFNSIVAGNTDNGTAPDLQKAPSDALSVSSSLIGRNNGTGLTATGTTPDINGNLIGGATDGTRINPLLGPLSENGGPTRSQALLTGSPAIDRGDSSVAVDVTDSNSPLTTDQRGTPFGRSADASVDMGSYERQTVAGLSLIVDTNQDENDGNYATGDLSLREAIGLANGSLGPNTITFATTTNGTEFDLTLGEMLVTETLTITGNGATNTVIDGQQLSRILNLQTGDLTLDGVTLKNGKTTADFNGGGAIASSSSGVLTIRNSTLSGNTTQGDFANGGGIFASSGAVTLTNSTVSGNSTAGSTANGGGIYSNSGAVTLTGSTVSENSTARVFANGGGIYSNSGAVTLTGSTVSENSTAGDNANGGGIFAFSGAVTLTNSTVSGNTTAGDFANGGGISSLSGAITLTNSTVSGNTTAGDVAHNEQQAMSNKDRHCNSSMSNKDRHCQGATRSNKEQQGATRSNKEQLSGDN